MTGLCTGSLALGHRGTWWQGPQQVLLPSRLPRLSRGAWNRRPAPARSLLCLPGRGHSVVNQGPLLTTSSPSDGFPDSQLPLLQKTHECDLSRGTKTANLFFVLFF